MAEMGDGGPRRDIGWQEFGDLTKQLALTLHERGGADAVVGIARGGDIVGATLSFMLGFDYYPMRLFKHGGVVRVVQAPAAEVRGRSVLLVDDLSRTGETFKIAVHELRRLGVERVATVALVRREPGFRPDVCAVVASAADKVFFPWGAEVLVGGKFEPRKL